MENLEGERLVAELQLLGIRYLSRCTAERVVSVRQTASCWTLMP